MKIDVKLQYTIESDLSHFTDEHLAYVVEKRIGISTILHGPESLHEAMRPQYGGAAYAVLRDALRRLREATEERGEESNITRLEASLSIGTKTAECVAEIIEAYSKIGVQAIAIEPPATHLTRSEQTDYLATYRKLLRAVLNSALKGQHLVSRETATIARRILSGLMPDRFFPRFPTGPGIESWCIDPDGKVWTSEAGRLAAGAEEELFHIGHVQNAIYAEITSHDVIRSMTVASVLEGHPGCVNCAYLPFCGVSPEYNLLHQQSLSGRMLESSWCKFMLVLHDFVFDRLRLSIPEEREVLEKGQTNDSAATSICRPNNVEILTLEC